MAAEVYSGVEGIEKPEFGDWNTYAERVRAYQEELKAWCEQNGKGKYKGKMVRFPVADGFAIYYILSLSPLVLIHDDSGDGYQNIHIKYLPVKVIRAYADMIDPAKK